MFECLVRFYPPLLPVSLSMSVCNRDVSVLFLESLRLLYVFVFLASSALRDCALGELYLWEPPWVRTYVCCVTLKVPRGPRLDS